MIIMHRSHSLSYISLSHCPFFIITTVKKDALWLLLNATGLFFWASIELRFILSPCKKSARYNILIEKLKILEPNATHNSVVKKLYNIRSAFRKELKKNRELKLWWVCSETEVFLRPEVFGGPGNFWSKKFNYWTGQCQ